MTVAVQDPINQFVISSVAQTTGPWTWQLNQASDLTVFKLSFDTGLITTLVLGTDYSVNSADLGNKLGGTITFLSPAQIPPVVEDVWTLQRNTELIRKKDFATSGDFQAITVNPQFDDPILIAQDTQRDAAAAVRKNPAIGDKLNPLIPQMVDRRTIIFEETTPGNFDMVMSDSDPDDQSNAAAQSAAEAAVSASDAASSESLAAEDAAAAAEDADDAAASAAEAAQSVGELKGLYSLNRIAGPYIGDNFVTDGEAPEPQGVTFSPSGLTMFVVDSGSNNIFQYSLTHSFNMHEGNVTFTGLSFNIEGESIENPQDVKFNTNGTKMFVLAGTPSNQIREYDLTNGFDFTIPPVDSTDFFSVAVQETQPKGLVFSPDGFTMFIVGLGNTPKEVNRYDLTVAFSMAGGNVVPDIAFTLPNEIQQPQSLAFSSDGTEMFVLNQSAPGSILDFSVPTAFSFSPSPIATGNEFNTGTVDDTPTGMIFSTDGTKIFVTGQEFQAVYEYIMPRAFDLPHGVTFSGLEFSVSGQTNNTRGMAFNNDGTRMFVAGDDALDKIFQYDLSVPYSLEPSNVVFNGVSYTVAETTNIATMVFNEDGSRMFVAGILTHTVYEYTLSTNYDLGSTVVFTTLSFDFTNEDNLTTGIVFGQDGFKLYMVGGVTTNVFEYDLVVPYSLAASNVIFNGNFFDALGEVQNGGLRAVAFSPDGLFMFLAALDAVNSKENLFQYELLTPFNLAPNVPAAVTYNDAFFGIHAQDQSMRGFVFNSDGTKFFASGRINNSVYEYDLGFPFRITQFIYPIENDENGLLLQVGTVLGDVEVILPNSNDLVVNFRVGVVKVSDDTNKVIVRNQGDEAINIDKTGLDLKTLDKVVGFFLDQAEPNWIADIGEFSKALYNENQKVTSATQVPFASGFSFADTAADNLPKGVAFSKDGFKLFILGAQNQNVYQYTLSHPFSLEFGITGPIQTLFVGDRLTSPEDIVFSTAGLNLYVVGTGAAGPLTGPSVIEYTLGSAFDISVGVFLGFFDVSGEDSLPKSVRFSSTGRKMFVLGNTNNRIYQYALATANTVSTATFDVIDVSVNAEDTAPIGIDFSKDGTLIFMIGDTSDTVYQYTVGTAFTLEGFSFTGESFVLPGGGLLPRSIAFQDNVNPVTGAVAGSKFFVVEAPSGGKVVEFICPTPYDLSQSLVITPGQNGFLFTVDTTGGPLDIILPDSSLLVDDFRIGIVKISGDANLIIVLADPQGTDTVNAGASVSLSIQNKVTLISLDRATGNWTADVGEPIQQKSGSSVFDLTTATGNNAFVVTGLGFTPKNIIFMMSNTTLALALAFMGNETNSVCVFNSGGTATTFRPLGNPVFETSSTNTQTLALQSLDSDGFTLSNIKTNSPTGTLSITWMAFG